MAQNKEKIAAYQKIYYEQNKEQILARVKVSHAKRKQQQHGAI